MINHPFDDVLVKIVFFRKGRRRPCLSDGLGERSPYCLRRVQVTGKYGSQIIWISHAGKLLGGFQNKVSLSVKLLGKYRNRCRVCWRCEQVIFDDLRASNRQFVVISISQHFIVILSPQSEKRILRRKKKHMAPSEV